MKPEAVKQKKEENVNLPYDMEQENKRFEIWKENEQVVFCILSFSISLKNQKAVKISLLMR